MKPTSEKASTEKLCIPKFIGITFKCFLYVEHGAMTQYHWIGLLKSLYRCGFPVLIENPEESWDKSPQGESIIKLKAYLPEPSFNSVKRQAKSYGIHVEKTNDVVSRRFIEVENLREWLKGASPLSKPPARLNVNPEVYKMGFECLRKKLLALLEKEEK